MDDVAAMVSWVYVWFMYPNVCLLPTGNDEDNWDNGRNCRWPFSKIASAVAFRAFLFRLFLLSKSSGSSAGRRRC